MTTSALVTDGGDLPGVAPVDLLGGRPITVGGLGWVATGIGQPGCDFHKGLFGLGDTPEAASKAVAQSICTPPTSRWTSVPTPERRRVAEC